MKTLYFSLISLVIFTISCSKEIPFKGDLGNGFIVVNGIFENDSVMKVTLSKSTPSIGEVSTAPSEISSLANVTVTDNTSGEIFSSNSVNFKGEYEFGAKAKEGHSYSISVTYPDFKTATSKMTIPTPVQIQSCDVINIDGFNGVQEKQIGLTINDPSSENFYGIRVLNIDTLFNTKSEVSISPDQNPKQTDNFSPFHQVYLFSDELFNGTTKKVNVYAFIYPVYNSSDTLGNTNTQETIFTPQLYQVQLYSLSKEVYNYVTSTTKAVNSNQNPLSEPVKVFTNITDGLGVFGGVSSSSIFIKF